MMTFLRGVAYMGGLSVLGFAVSWRPFTWTMLAYSVILALLSTLALIDHWKAPHEVLKESKPDEIN